MKKIIYILLISIIIINLSGCAALFKGTNSPLDISSNPQGAKVYVNGTFYGTTPLKIRLKSDQTYRIEFKKEGFKTITRVVNSRIGAGWIILDILVGLVPIIIDAATGAWYELDQKSVDAILEEQQP